jgi:hypothetical protein
MSPIVPRRRHGFYEYETPTPEVHRVGRWTPGRRLAWSGSALMLTAMLTSGGLHLLGQAVGMFAFAWWAGLAVLVGVLAELGAFHAFGGPPRWGRFDG